MVKRITKVTTKKGDDGSTRMADGSKVSKSDPIINAIGELDELNSWVGLLTSLKELENKNQSAKHGLEKAEPPTEQIMQEVLRNVYKDEGKKYFVNKILEIIA